MTFEDDIENHRLAKLDEITNDIRYHREKLKKLEMEYEIFKTRL